MVNRAALLHMAGKEVMAATCARSRKMLVVSRPAEGSGAMRSGSSCLASQALTRSECHRKCVVLPPRPLERHTPHDRDHRDPRPFHSPPPCCSCLDQLTPSIWSSFVMLQPEGESTRCERKSWSPHRVVGLLPSVDRRPLLSSVVHVQYFDANAVVIS